MATSVTHIVLTAKIYDKLFSDKNKKEFFVGTLFPDIRYLKVIARNKTHFFDLTISAIQAEDSFLAGVKFHSLLDVTREKFITDNDVYSLCPESKYITQSLKILEDELFYKHITDWSEYINYFNEVLPTETNFDVTKSDIQRWHTILQNYFQKQPDEQSVTDFILASGFPIDVATEINATVATLKTNPKIITILENLYLKFQNLIK
jgi:hypothetical protein